MFKVILFFIFTQFRLEFWLVLKIGYLFDLNSESFDLVSLDSLFHQLSVDRKFIKFHDHLSPKFNV